uniref:Uncharacterized protein n=1 Tax=Panagrellus redivivus TaxID=6233 RepID=A0A7E4W0B6_PANRE
MFCDKIVLPLLFFVLFTAVSTTPKILIKKPCVNGTTNKKGALEFKLLGDGTTCQRYPLTVTNKGFYFTIKTHITDDQYLGDIKMMIGKKRAQIIPFNVAVKRSQFLIRDTELKTLVSSAYGEIKLFVSSTGQVYSHSNDQEPIRLLFPPLSSLPTNENHRTLHLGISFSGVAKPVSIQFQGETSNRFISASFPNPETTTPDTSLSPNTRRLLFPETTPITISASQHTTLQFSGVQIGALVGFIIFFIVLAVSAISFWCICRRCRSKSKSRPTASQSNRPGESQRNAESAQTEIQISYDGYDLVVPGHAEERLDYVKADAAKKSKMVDIFMKRRQRHQSQSTGERFGANV